MNGNSPCVPHHPQPHLRPPLRTIFDFARALSEAGNEVCLRFIGDGMEPHQAAEDVSALRPRRGLRWGRLVSNVLDRCPRDSRVPTLFLGTANLFFNNIGDAPEPPRWPRPAAEAVPRRPTWESCSEGETAASSAALSSSSRAPASMPTSCTRPSPRETWAKYGLLSSRRSPTPRPHRRALHHRAQREVDRARRHRLRGGQHYIQNDINLFPDCRVDDGFIDMAVMPPAKTVEYSPPCLRRPRSRR